MKDSPLKVIVFPPDQGCVYLHNGKIIPAKYFDHADQKFFLPKKGFRESTEFPENTARIISCTLFLAITLTIDGGD